MVFAVRGLRAAGSVQTRSRVLGERQLKELGGFFNSTYKSDTLPLHPEPVPLRVEWKGVSRLLDPKKVISEDTKNKMIQVDTTSNESPSIVNSFPDYFNQRI